MKVGIHQPNFMPWVGFFEKINKSDIFIFLDDVECSKNSFFNRNKFSQTKKIENTFWLTCPIKKHYYKMMMKDVYVQKDFIKKHKKHFAMRHGKTKEKLFLDKIQQIYEEQESNEIVNLVDMNIQFIKCVCEELEMKDVKFIKSSSISIKKEAKKQERIIEIVKALKGKTYISGRGASSYQHELDFLRDGINLNYLKHNFKDLTKIREENLSIIDLILIEGTCKIKKMILH
jgi:hypothetical protein